MYHQYIWWIQTSVTTQIVVHSSNRHGLTSLSLITFYLRVFSNRRPFQILRAMADLLVRVRAYVSDVIASRFEKVGNDHRFENCAQIWEFGKGHRFENWTPIWEFKKKDKHLMYRCQWRRNRTYIWGLDVD